MGTVPPVTVDIYRQLVLEVGDRFLRHLHSTAVEAVSARRQMGEPSQSGGVTAALDRAIAELEVADRDVRETLAAIALNDTTPLPDTDAI